MDSDEAQRKREREERKKKLEEDRRKEELQRQKEREVDPRLACDLVCSSADRRNGSESEKNDANNVKRNGNANRSRKRLVMCQRHIL